MLKRFTKNSLFFPNAIAQIKKTKAYQAAERKNSTLFLTQLSVSG